MRVVPVVCLVFFCCLETMFRAGHASSMSCNAVAVWRPCFVQVVPAAYLIILLLSGDHALFGSCQQHVL